MRITSIELAGRTEHSARIAATSDSDYVEVTLVRPDGHRTPVMIAVDCDEDLWSMAECLQFHLDGVRGTNSDIRDYYRELERFAN